MAMGKPKNKFWMVMGLVVAAGALLPILVSHDFRELTGAAFSNLMAKAH